jgi:hypothetical protein
MKEEDMAGKWHPDFPLEELPEIPMADILRPNSQPQSRLTSQTRVPPPPAPARARRFGFLHLLWLASSLFAQP